MDFVAIDFETATGYRDSACAVGIVTVENGKIVEEYHQLIQPPGNVYLPRNIEIHGITPDDTAAAHLFPTVYAEIKKRLTEKTVVAHNESFDRGVLQACMQRHELDYTELSLPTYWECTLRIYRQKGFSPCDLATLSRRHDIELNHHDALSDARACAKLYMIHNRSISK